MLFLPAAGLCLHKDCAHFVRSGPSHCFLRPADAELVSNGHPPASRERGSSGLRQAAIAPENKDMYTELLLQSLAVGFTDCIPYRVR